MHRTFAEEDTFCEADKRAITLQAWTGPLGSKRLRLPEFLDSWYMKVVWSSVLHTGHLNPPQYIPGTHFCYRLSQAQGHSAPGRIKSMKNPYDPIRNQAHDLLSCNPVTQCLDQLCHCISHETDNLLEK